MFCPQCGKEYDDSFAFCPHCGIEKPSVEETPSQVAPSPESDYTVCRKGRTGPCAHLVNDCCELGYDPNNETCWAARNGYTKNIGKCPTCGSTRIMRFSPGYKVLKIASFGPFGLGNVHKIFQCGDCGYKW